MLTLIFTILTPLFAEFQVCDFGSACGKCQETIRLAFSPDVHKGRVLVTGAHSETSDEEYFLDDCQIRDRNNWSCISTVTRFEATKGVVKISQPGSDRPFEICMR